MKYLSVQLALLLPALGLLGSFAQATDYQWHAQPVVPGGRIDAVAYLGDGVVLAGSRDPNPGRLFKSTDGGRTWQNQGDVFAADGLAASVSSIASAGDGTAYVLTGTSVLWKTENKGESWRNLGRIHTNDRLEPFLHSYSIAALDSGTLLVSDTNPTGGHVYRSVNGGGDWQDLGAVSGAALYRFTTTDNGVLLNGWGGRVYRSGDDGQNWQPSRQIEPSPLYATVYLDNRIALQGSEGGKLYRSTDHGKSWRRIGKPGGAADDFVYLGDGEVIYTTYTGTRHLFLSKDYGKSWTDIGPVPTGVEGDILDHVVRAPVDGHRGAVGGTKAGYLVRVDREDDQPTRKPNVGAWYFNDPANPGKASIGADLIVDNTNGTLQAVDGPGDAAAIRLGTNDNLALDRASKPVLNSYSLVVDLRIPKGDGRWRGILHTGHRESNAHLWIDGDTGVMGHGNLPGAFSIDSGYTTHGIEREKWYRIVFYGSSKPGKQAYFKFTVLDEEGELRFTEHRYGEERFDQQHALHELVRFFHSEDDASDRSLDVATLGVYDDVLSQSQAESLGAPGTVIPEPSTRTAVGAAPCTKRLRLFQKAGKVSRDRSGTNDQ